MTAERALSPEEALEALEHWRLIVEAAERWEAAPRAPGRGPRTSVERDLAHAVRALHEHRRTREVPQ